MNAHEVMVAAVLTAFLNAPPLASGNVVRGRRRPIDDTVDEFIAVYFAGSVPDRNAITGAPIDWRTNVRFDCYKRGSSTQTADQAALALHAQAWDRLFATPTLSGLVMDMAPLPIAPGDEDELDTPLGQVSGAVQLLHRTAYNTLEI